MDKEFILSEIRRCAEENDGLPLGKSRFEAATGIRESHWSGRYWARWSDAQAEAGYTPNELSVKKHTDEELVKFLADLTCDLGHYPSGPERSMYKRQNPNFPDPKVFSGRLGRRDEQLRRLVDYGNIHPEFSAVADICSPLIDVAPSENLPSTKTNAQPGYVYLLKSGANYKIGRSNSLGRRTYEIALQLPERLTLVHAIETDDAVGIERYWHQRFADRRLNGEWFKLSSADVAAFKSRRRFM